MLPLLIAELARIGSVTQDVDTRERLGPAYEDLPRRIPDDAKACRLLGWTCKTSLHEGLRKTIEWARGNPAWLALPDSGAA